MINISRFFLCFFCLGILMFYWKEKTCFLIFMGFKYFLFCFSIHMLYFIQGDQVEEFQRLCEVQSDKATIEITSRYSGRVCNILHSPGNIVKVNY